MARDYSYRLPNSPINHIPIDLIMIRHGKPVRDNKKCDEADRALTRRGVLQAHAIAHVLELDTTPIDLMVSSFARRSWETARALSLVMANKPERLFLEQLYPEDTHETVKIMDTDEDCVALRQFFDKVGPRVFRKYAHAFHMRFAQSLVALYGSTRAFRFYSKDRPFRVVLNGHQQYLQAIALQYAYRDDHRDLLENNVLQFAHCLRLIGTLDKIESVECFVHDQ